jgi:hypothetical protein
MDNIYPPFEKLSREQQQSILIAVAFWILRDMEAASDPLGSVNHKLKVVGLMLITTEEYSTINQAQSNAVYEMEYIGSNAELTIQDLLSSLSRILISQQSDTDKVLHIKQLIGCQNGSSS